jgi:hypothetical protein
MTHPAANEAEIIREAADYDCAMAKARPLPTWIYRFQNSPDAALSARRLTEYLIAKGNFGFTTLLR